MPIRPTMTVKPWHLVVVGAVAVAALAGVLTMLLTGSKTHGAQTVVVVPDTPAPSTSDLDTALANVRTALPSIEAYYGDNGSYDGASIAGLRRDYDSGLPQGLRFGFVHSESYCVEASVGDATAYLVGPGSSGVTPGNCPAAP